MFSFLYIILSMLNEPIARKHRLFLSTTLTHIKSSDRGLLQAFGEKEKILETNFFFFLPPPHFLSVYKKNFIIVVLSHWRKKL